ncbi:MAG: DUF4438 domain-containing protein [Dongiaceae bacterium]
MGDAVRPRDNRAALLRSAVAGRLAPARLIGELAGYDAQGRIALLPGCGGIALGVHVGDPVDRWVADHLMPGATAEAEGDPAEPGAFHELACLGNRVRDRAGRPLGRVAGKRGGLAPGFMPPNLLAIEAPDALLATLAPGDPVVLEAEGRGLALPDLPEVGLCNLSPAALDALPLRLDGASLVVAVRAVVPARIAGAGVGQSPWIGDVEIAGTEVLAGSLEGLRFGDLVAFDALDSRVSRFHRPGFVTVGTVAHGPSPTPGHGPGITVLLSGPAALLRTEIVPEASLAALFA